MRQDYRITEAGRHALALLRLELRALVGEGLNEEWEYNDGRHDRHT